MSSLIKAQGVGDLYRMYTDAQANGIDFNAIWIPESFTLEEPTPFDPGYMRGALRPRLPDGRERDSLVEGPAQIGVRLIPPRG